MAYACGAYATFHKAFVEMVRHPLFDAAQASMSGSCMQATWKEMSSPPSKGCAFAAVVPDFFSFKKSSNATVTGGRNEMPLTPELDSQRLMCGRCASNLRSFVSCRNGHLAPFRHLPEANSWKNLQRGRAALTAATSSFGTCSG